MGPAILWLPLTIFVGVCFGVAKFFASSLSSSRKAFVALLFIAGAVLCVVFTGHCDVGGFCTQTHTERIFTDTGAILIILAVLVGLTG